MRVSREVLAMGKKALRAPLFSLDRGEKCVIEGAQRAACAASGADAGERSVTRGT